MFTIEWTWLYREEREREKERESWQSRYQMKCLQWQQKVGCLKNCNANWCRFTRRTSRCDKFVSWPASVAPPPLPLVSCFVSESSWLSVAGAGSLLLIVPLSVGLYVCVAIRLATVAATTCTLLLSWDSWVEQCTCCDCRLPYRHRHGAQHWTRWCTDHQSACSSVRDLVIGTPGRVAYLGEEGLNDL